MAQQWFAVREKATQKIVSYSSDDSQGHGRLPANLEYVGPFATQAAAQAAAEPAVDPAAAIRAALLAKPSAAWTTQDIADFLKIRG